MVYRSYFSIGYDIRFNTFRAAPVAINSFYRAARSSDENSVRLSVCPSVTRVDCDKTEERSVQIFIPHER